MIFVHLVVELHLERPVATQRPLCNCVDHLAAPSHIEYMQHHELELDSSKANLTVEGH